MKIDHVILRQISLPLIQPFETSFGKTEQKEAVLVEIQSEGQSGWGECVAGEGPFYSDEDVYTAWEVLARWIVPPLIGRDAPHPEELPGRLHSIRGHRMAKAALEAALWDLLARLQETPLWKLLGGSLTQIPCGVSIGIQASLDDLVHAVEKELSAGYRRIKIKIRPGWDLEPVAELRRRFPGLPLMVDANSAYTPRDTSRLQELDAFDLLMIEQPLFEDDLVEHCRLQSGLRTPICLDESIHHLRAARQALELGACRVINIKFGRVGGLGEARRIHDLCRDRNVPVWCGGMLETGIGRAHNVALSTLPNFRLPGDVSAASRYFLRDTVEPAVEVTPDGYILPFQTPGIGCRPDLPFIERITTRRLCL